MKLTKTKTLLALTLSSLTASLYAAPYEVVDLGGLGGGFSLARDINEAGIASGYADTVITTESGRLQSVQRAVLFDDAGNIDLGNLENGSTSDALSVNDAMTAVGLATEILTVERSDGTTVNVQYQYGVFFESGVITKLPELANLSGVTAFGINNSEEVILSGRYDEDANDDIDAVTRAFVYDRGTDTYTMIEPLAEGADRNSSVVDINNSGYVVGFTDAEVDGQQTIKSFVASTTDLTQLTELPEIGERTMLAQGMNDLNQVVGNVSVPNTNSQREAFFVDMSLANPEAITLGFFDSRFNDSRANDINNNQQIVGRALVSTPTLGEYGAFIYENGQMKNLNELIACDSEWVLTEATAINDSGQIVGFGALDGEVRAFRLDPTGGAIEDCSTESPSSGGGSLPAMLVTVLAIFGIRRKYYS